MPKKSGRQTFRHLDTKGFEEASEWLEMTLGSVESRTRQKIRILEVPPSELRLTPVSFSKRRIFF